MSRRELTCIHCGVTIVAEDDRQAERRMENHFHLAHPVVFQVDTRPADEEAVREAAKALADARVRYAQEFARFRLRMQSDGAAHQAAVESTKSEITVLEAELKIAERRLS